MNINFVLPIVLLSFFLNSIAAQDTLQSIREKADKNDPYYQALLVGEMLKGIQGENKDYQKARILVQKAAFKNHPFGHYYLGQISEFGFGEEQNVKAAQESYELAFEGIEKLAKGGDQYAIHMLVQMYTFGKGVKKDSVKALKWLRLGLDKKDIRSISNLGYLYMKGILFPRDQKIAKSFFMQAAEKGHRKSQRELGLLYVKEKDKKLSEKWLKSAAELGDPIAQYNLALLYKRGDLLNKDLKKSFFYFEMSANWGYEKAQCNLAYMYLKGHGIIKDEKNAAIWFHKSANQGYRIAMENLALMYEKGIGVDQIPSKALEWREKASAAY